MSNNYVRGNCNFNEFLNNKVELPPNFIKQPVAFRSKKIQTICRDSETQTIPYSPLYTVSKGEKLEILNLVDLKYGHGLPAGLRDIEAIERSRRRQDIEANLQPYEEIAHDPKLVAKRKKILEDLETKEWFYREKEIEALQEVRQTVLIELLSKKEKNQQEIIMHRLDQIWTQRWANKEYKTKQIRFYYITALRKLMKQRSTLTTESNNKRDIIKDYANLSSTIFCPTLCRGVFPDRNSDKCLAKSRYLTNLKNLEELEMDINLKTKITLKPPKKYTVDGFLKRQYRHQNELTNLLEYLKSLEVNKEVVHRKPICLERIPKPVPRSVTPTIDSENKSTTPNETLAIIYLQKLIRGRAVQNQMYENKEDRRPLINELRSTHALVNDERAEKERQKIANIGRQEQYESVLKQDDQLTNVLESFSSHNLAEMLCFLSNELDRLIYERRIHAKVLLAERIRRIREAEESGNRQREERLRREHDEIFKQLVKVHQQTVDGYLASVSGLAIDSTADLVAQSETVIKAAEIDQIAREYQKRLTEISADELAADMVYNVLIPEVNKRSYELNQDRRNRQFLHAAHMEIWNATSEESETLPESNKMIDGED